MKKVSPPLPVKLYVLVFLGIAFCSCTHQKFYFVRHAEKVHNTSADPGLSPLGIQRSYILRDSFLKRPITYIYTSQYTRTIQTAEPLSNALKLDVKVIPAEQQQILISELRNLKKNQTALVVAHSNTIPLLIKQLCGIEINKIDDYDYDDIFIITLKQRILGRNKFALEIINYGTPTN